jgi:hypothetical protein
MIQNTPSCFLIPSWMPAQPIIRRVALLWIRTLLPLAVLLHPASQCTSRGRNWPTCSIRCRCKVRQSKIQCIGRARYT